jgi:UrcA family protein
VKAHIKFLGLPALLAASAALANAPTTASKSETDVRQTVVTYSDLDLIHPSGVARLYQRIRSAAEQVCRPYDARSLAQQQRSEACIDQAVRRAVDSIGVPELSKLHARRTGKSFDSRALIASDR